VNDSLVWALGSSGYGEAKGCTTGPRSVQYQAADRNQIRHLICFSSYLTISNAKLWHTRTRS